MGGALAYDRPAIDILVKSRSGKPVIVAEIKAGSRQRPEDKDYYLQILQSNADRVDAPYMLLVTPSEIDIWRRAVPTDVLVLTRPVRPILDTYQVFGQPAVISHLALEIAAKQWLQDLILHWRSQNPPFQHELEEMGLIQEIAGGDVAVEVLV